MNKNKQYKAEFMNMSKESDEALIRDDVTGFLYKLTRVDRNGELPYLVLSTVTSIT